MTIAIGLASAVGIIASNFIYQAAFGNADWAVAVERSYFQLIAIVLVTGPIWLMSLRTH